MNSTGEMNEHQSLCLSCGLCCDGTLFERVPLQPSDDRLPLKTAGIKIQRKNAENHFSQPCVAYRKNCCQVYADRPANCQRYRCKLLQRVEKGKISGREAERKIKRALELKEAFEKEFRRILPQSSDELSLSAAQKLMPDNKKMIVDPALLKKWGLAMLRLSVLLGSLKNDFQFSEEETPAAERNSTDSSTNRECSKP